MSSCPLSTSTSRYLPQLDSLRGLAALAVVVAHFNPGPASVPPNSALGWVMDLWQTFALGNVAVVFFFTLSAFLLTYLACLEQERQGSFSAGRFMIRRILRIWLLYFCVLGTAALLYSQPTTLPLEFSASADTWNWVRNHLWYYVGFISNWSLTFNYIGLHVDPSPGALRILWSIGVEEQFYVVYPLVLLAMFRYPRVRLWLGVGTLAAAWGFRLWFSTLDVANPNLRSAGGKYYATFSYLDVLLAGAVAGWFAAGHPASRMFAWLGHPWAGPLLIVLSAAAGAAWSPHRWYPYGFTSLIIYPIMGGIFALFLVWISTNSQHPWLRVLAWPPLRRLGDLSYGIYMQHVISNTFLATWLRNLGVDSFLYSSAWARLVGSLFAAVAFAAASRLLIELPFLRLKARFRRVPP